jgi:hypothetical protein
MERITEMHRKSVSNIPVLQSAHYKKKYSDYRLDERATLETNLREFKECLKERNAMAQPPISEEEAVQDLLNRLPSSYDVLKIRLASEEAVKHAQGANNPMAFLLDRTGYPQDINTLSSIISAFHEASKRLVSENKTKGRSFSSMSNREDEDSNDKHHGRNYSSYHSGGEDEDNKRHRRADSPHPAGLHHEPRRCELASG